MSCDASNPLPPRKRRHGGPKALAKRRALALAEADRTDEEILRVLRHEFLHDRAHHHEAKDRLTPAQLEAAFAVWKEALEDARAAGRAYVSETLHATAIAAKPKPASETADGEEPPTATRERIQAAIHLAKAHDATDAMDSQIAREVKRLLGMGVEGVIAEVEGLLGKLRGAT